MNKTDDLGNFSAAAEEFGIGSGFYFSPVFNTYLALPEAQAIATIVVLCFFIFTTLIGNILVILSVFTYPPLKIPPNYFIVSLAAADITVAVLVLPLNVVVNVSGRFPFGPGICKMWLTADVLCCTASILNLCAIALDRYMVMHKVDLF